MKKAVTEVYSNLRFVLLNPGVLIPPILRMIVEKVRRKRSGMEHPFYNCIVNRDDVSP
jgi:hypothetical protein